MGSFRFNVEFGVTELRTTFILSEGPLLDILYLNL